MCIRDRHTAHRRKGHRAHAAGGGQHVGRINGVGDINGACLDAIFIVGAIGGFPKAGVQFLHRVTPVSYTHLDVYKRQVQKQCAGIFADVLFLKADEVFHWFITEFHGFCPLSLVVFYSYCSIPACCLQDADVYKRQSSIP